MRRDLRHTLELGAGAGIVALCTFAYVLGVARMLGPRAYADFSAAMAIFYFVAVALSPLAPTTSRLVARYLFRNEPHRVDALQGALERHVIRGSAILAIPVLFALIPLGRMFHFASPAPAGLALLSTAFFTVVSIRRGVLQGRGEFRVPNLNGIFEAALRLLLVFVMLAFWPTPAAALASYLVAVAVATLLLRRRVKWVASDVDWKGVRQLAGPLFVSMIGVAVFQSADLLVVKRWFPAEVAGQYAAASTLARSISVLFVPIYTVAGPMLTGLHERRQALLVPTMRLCLYFLAMAVVPVTICAVAGESVIVALYGQSFRGAGALLWRLSGVAVLTYLSLIVAQALITIGDRRFAPLYLGFTVLQIAALVLARYSLDTIILSQYFVQGPLLLAMLLAASRIGNRTSAAV
jgi:O-antigen/teichoic acid export membrane protein